MRFLKRRRVVLILASKKGQFLQVALAIVIILVMAIVSVFVFQASDSLNDSFQQDVTLTNESKATYDSLNTAYPSLFDGIIMLVFVGLWVLSMVVAFNSDSNPLLLFISLFIIAALAVVGMILNNVWVSVYDSSESGGFAQQFPMTNFLLDKYLLVVLVMGFSCLYIGITRVSG